MTDFEKVMKYFADKSYADLITPLFELIAISIGLLFVWKQKLGLFFLAYLTIDLLMWFCDIYVEASSHLSRRHRILFVGQTNLLIAFVELSTYFYFFSKILHNKLWARVMKITLTIFTLSSIVLITTRFGFLTQRITYITDVVSTIEFLLLIPPYLIYFHELFSTDLSINLYQRPSFWIVTGIFFYSVISVPYYLVESFLLDNQPNYWPLTYLLFFSLPLAINFIFLAKAFLCRKSLSI